MIKLLIKKRKLTLYKNTCLEEYLKILDHMQFQKKTTEFTKYRSILLYLFLPIFKNQLFNFLIVYFKNLSFYKNEYTYINQQNINMILTNEILYEKIFIPILVDFVTIYK